MAALKVLKTFILTSAFLFLTACSTVDEPTTLNAMAINQLPINNLGSPKELLFTGGQPSQEQLKALAEAGIKHIINLRPLQEQEQAQQWNEAELVQSLNMQYHAIPVAGATGVNIENANTLAELVKNLDGDPIFLHCASSNRVGALTALYEGAVNEVNTDEAISIGKRWGLSSLEPIVRSQLTHLQ